MEIDNQQVFNPNTFGEQSTREVTILCCLCGTSFSASAAKTNICLKCLSSTTDITTGITKQGILNYCRQCRRYMRPPWVLCELESKELLSLCLKKIKGLNKVQLVDASFIWTEPHSKRIKVKITVQKEIMSGPTVVQTFPVEFIVHYQQCEDCQKSFTPHKWEASVQVRQKVDNKKTFHFLEQLILKHNAHEKVLNVKTVNEGLDFFFKSKSNAQRLLDFLQSIFPCKIKSSKQLIGQDDHQNLFSYKYVFSVEIPKVCRDDLVIISPKLMGMLGGCSQILVCTKVASMIHFLDPYTMQVIEMTGLVYFQHEIDMTFMSIKTHGTEFTVFDIESVNPKTINSSFQTVRKDSVVRVSVGRSTDWKMFEVRTHLGDLLKEGDTVLGFDLSSMNISGETENNKNLHNLPEVIIIKKVYPERKKNRRIWKIKTLPKEEGEERKKKEKKEGKKDDSFEEFLDEIEADPDMRSNMNLYRDEKAIKELGQKGTDIAFKDTKKKVRAKKGKNPDAIPEEKVEEPEIKEEKPKGTEEENQMVRIEELLSDLTLNETEGVAAEVLDNNALNDFISKMSNIKIEK